MSTRRDSSSFQGPYGAPGSGYTPVQFSNQDGAQQYGARRAHDDMQPPPQEFPPSGKPYDYRDNNIPPNSFPYYNHPALHADAAFPGQPPSRGASPSPAGTTQSLATSSLFSTQSSASSTFTHPSSSGISFCDGGESSGSQSHALSNFRPQSPAGRPQSPFSRPTSRACPRPGSPLGRHQPSHNGSRAHQAFSGVSRPASRRGRLGSTTLDHIPHQILLEMGSERLPFAGWEEQEPLQSLEACLQEDLPTSPCGEQTNIVRCGAHLETTPARSKQVHGLDKAFEFHYEAEHSAGSPISQSSQDATMTGLSDADAESPKSFNGDEAQPERAIRVLRTILGEEFDLRLGISEPPKDMVEAVTECLDQISLSRQQHRCRGFIVPIASIPVSADTPTETTSSSGGTDASGKSRVNGKKRAASGSGGGEEDGAPDEDGDREEGGAACFDPSGLGNRKKAKIELFPCPFRKRNPTKFNIREWEYCAKAPFRSITELKKHLKKYHEQEQLAFRCMRCHTSFASQEELKVHARLDSDKMCKIRSDREGSPSVLKNETMSNKVGERLRNRAEHFDWVGIWQVLFPNDHPNEIPKPEFEPAVELHEVSRTYKESLAELASKLTTATPPGLEVWSSACLNIFSEFMDGVFQRSQIQAAAGLASYSTPSKRQPQPPSKTPSPFPRTHAGTPSSSVTSNSAHRQIVPRANGLAASERSGTSTPASIASLIWSSSSPSPLGNSVSSMLRSTRGGTGGRPYPAYRQVDQVQPETTTSLSNLDQTAIMNAAHIPSAPSQPSAQVPHYPAPVAAASQPYLADQPVANLPGGYQRNPQNFSHFPGDGRQNSYGGYISTTIAAEGSATHAIPPSNATSESESAGFGWMDPRQNAAVDNRRTGYFAPGVHLHHPVGDGDALTASMNRPFGNGPSNSTGRFM